MKLKGRWVRRTCALSMYETRNHTFGAVEYRAGQPELFKWAAWLIGSAQDVCYLSTETAAKRHVTSALRELITDLQELHT